MTFGHSIHSITRISVFLMVATHLQTSQYVQFAADEAAGLDIVVASGTPHGCSGPEDIDVFRVGGFSEKRPNVGVRGISSSWIGHVSPMLYYRGAIRLPLDVCA